MARRKSTIQRRYRLHALSIHPFCSWCQCPLTEATATADHLVPLSRGGSNDWGNLCLACAACNHGRQNNLPGEDARPVVQPPQAARIEGPLLVAWTRYTGGRWRRTFRGRSAGVLLKGAQALVGPTGETVILRDGEEPIETPLPMPRSTSVFDDVRE